MKVNLIVFDIGKGMFYNFFRELESILHGYSVTVTYSELSKCDA